MPKIKPSEELEKLWKNLPQRQKEQREKDVLFSRFAIGKNKQSLQAIGKRYGITRERVRQIQNQGIKSLHKVSKQNKKIHQQICQKIKSLGKLISLETAAGLFLEKNNQEKEKNALHLFLRVNPFLKYSKETSTNYPFFTYKISQAKIKKEIQKTINYFKKIKKPSTLEDTARKLNFSKEKLKQIIKISKNLGLRNKKIGLANFPAINPRTTKAKIDLIFEKYKKPLHFTEIVKLIARENFSQKQPTAATVHNELIKHNQIFILVGRGTYALKSWGFMPGTVKEVIAQIIKKSQKKLTREEIIKKVLQQRLVKRNTILLNLSEFKKQISKENKKHKK